MTITVGSASAASFNIEVKEKLPDFLTPDLVFITPTAIHHLTSKIEGTSSMILPISTRRKIEEGYAAAKAAGKIIFSQKFNSYTFNIGIKSKFGHDLYCAMVRNSNIHGAPWAITWVGTIRNGPEANSTAVVASAPTIVVSKLADGDPNKNPDPYKILLQNKFLAPNKEQGPGNDSAPNQEPAPNKAPEPDKIPALDQSPDPNDAPSDDQDADQDSVVSITAEDVKKRLEDILPSNNAPMLLAEVGAVYKTIYSNTLKNEIAMIDAKATITGFLQSIGCRIWRNDKNATMVSLSVGGEEEEIAAEGAAPETQTGENAAAAATPKSVSDFSRKLKNRLAFAQLIRDVQTNFVFFDTSALMFDLCEAFFMNLVSALCVVNASRARDNVSVYTLTSVLDEIDKHIKTPKDSRVQEQALRAKTIVDSLRKHSLLKILDSSQNRLQGMPAFADPDFQVLATVYRRRDPIMIITQDSKLAQQLLRLNEDESVKGNYVSVQRIDNSGLGVLSSWESRVESYSEHNGIIEWGGVL